MTTIETLTDNERAYLSEHGPTAGMKALRIVDAQAVTITALEAQCQHDFALAAEWKRTAEEYRHESECERLRTEVARLTKALAAAEQGREYWLNQEKRRDEQKKAAESECAALRDQLQEARNEVRHYSAELEESRKVNQALRNIVEQTLGTMRVDNLQCESIDGGPMGTDARCRLRRGHGGGCEYV